MTTCVGCRKVCGWALCSNRHTPDTTSPLQTMGVLYAAAHMQVGAPHVFTGGGAAEITVSHLARLTATNTLESWGRGLEWEGSPTPTTVHAAGLRCAP